MKKNIILILLACLQSPLSMRVLYAQNEQEPPPPPTAEELAAKAEQDADQKRQALYHQAKEEDAKIIAKLEKDPFKGITIAATEAPNDLYPLQSVEADTGELTDLALEFIDAFADSERLDQLVDKDIQSNNWRKWRADAQLRTHGVSLLDMNKKQRQAAMSLLEHALSIEGYEEVSSIMTLNAVTGELNSAPEMYNQNMYWFSIFGNPEEEQPWGLQVDGNNLALNFVVVGNQVVLSPILFAAEPALAPSGTQFAGETALQFKREGALGFIQSLDEAQQKEAVISTQKSDNQLLAEAFSDNIDVPQEGLNAKTLTNAQKQGLLQLIRLWVGDLRDEHATVWLSNVEAQLNNTYIAWWGDISGEKPFYLRIVSPVILIEMDHQVSSALKSNPSYADDKPRIDYIKTVVRQPNGNDYAKALLKSLKSYQEENQ